MKLIFNCVHQNNLKEKYPKTILIRNVLKFRVAYICEGFNNYIIKLVTNGQETCVSFRASFYINVLTSNIRAI